ncbi:hypothetical protein Ahy_B03g068646 isoform F [Arachis hypogaea]|uniref:Uncharacterized protein n=1 Tax=Arachis hypogaea TaxID=3818 RepID=A0A445AAC9_ARAHY|nr:hypothetical protein Ahy_B03g068646 isoform F [Arachis hypogaea]
MYSVILQDFDYNWVAWEVEIFGCGTTILNQLLRIRHEEAKIGKPDLFAEDCIKKSLNSDDEGGMRSKPSYSFKQGNRRMVFFANVVVSLCYYYYSHSHEENQFGNILRKKKI